MGSDYWSGLVDWMKKEMLAKHKFIDAEDLNVFTVCDDPQKAADIIINFRKSDGRGGLQEPTGLKRI
jgi:hypothetical protein